MYSPQFTITNKLLKTIGIIEAAKEVIENSPLVPAWEAKFREDALVRTVHHGTHIEGNELNLTEAEKVLAGAKIVGRERDIQEVLNYRSVLKYIETFGEGEFTVDLRTKSLLDNYDDKLIVEVAGQKFTKQVSIRPILIFQSFPLGLILLGLGLGGIYFATLGGFIYRKKYMSRGKPVDKGKK